MGREGTYLANGLSQRNINIASCSNFRIYIEQVLIEEPNLCPTKVAGFIALLETSEHPQAPLFLQEYHSLLEQEKLEWEDMSPNSYICYATL
jgi:hypothetical protein